MKKKDLAASLGLIGACALCCAIPLLGGAAALGISSFFFNPVVIVVLTLVFVIIGVIVYRWRRASRSACNITGCSCNSCSNERG